jgi:hypothetical protein
MRRRRRRSINPSPQSIDLRSYWAGMALARRCKVNDFRAARLVRPASSVVSQKLQRQERKVIIFLVLWPSFTPIFRADYALYALTRSGTRIAPAM